MGFRYGASETSPCRTARRTSARFVPAAPMFTAALRAVPTAVFRAAAGGGADDIGNPRRPIWYLLPRNCLAIVATMAPVASTGAGCYSAASRVRQNGAPTMANRGDDTGHAGPAAGRPLAIGQAAVSTH
jgi:hypothetical protein